MARAPPTRFHWLKLRTTCHATEDLDRVQAALAFATGRTWAEVEEQVVLTRIESHHGGEVVLLEATITRAAEVRAALAVLVTDAAALRDELERRVDEDGVLHWRVAKQAAFLGRAEATRGDDAVQARLKVEVHPTSREAALVAFASWLDGLLEG